MAAKKAGLQRLIGKQVYVKGRYTDMSEGPFTLLSLDLPFLGLELDGKAFWWNANVIEALQEVPPKDEA